jgi:hypothetical protein
MKNYLLFILLVSITGCDAHKQEQTKDTNGPAFYEKKWENLPDNKQILGPVADPNDLDTVSVKEKRSRQAFDEDHMARDGHSHRAGFFQYENE